MKLTKEIRNELEGIYEKRSKHLKYQAYGVLVLILFSIVFGIYFFINADSVTRQENRTEIADMVYSNSGEVISQIQKDVTDHILKFDKLADSQFYIDSAFYRLRHDYKEKSDLAHNIQTYLYRIEDLVKLRNYVVSEDSTIEYYDLETGKTYNADILQDTFKTNIARLGEVVNSMVKENEKSFYVMGDIRIGIDYQYDMMKRILAIDSVIFNNNDNILNRIYDLDERLKKASNEIGAKSLESTNVVLSSSVTRVGIVLLLIFLVQILVSMYRYNIRLSVYYSARADMMKLTNGGVVTNEDLNQLAEVLTPKEINFGKVPASPAQHAVDLAREVMKGSKPGRSEG